ncbi:MAG: hypothetical protein HYR60_09590 [Acidobacteria bacterium]|nr:hypothetical protein [Acidobacteriota bacterium]
MLPLWAGEVAGRVVISKSLTKRNVTAAMYNLRGVSVSPERAGSGAASEYSRVAVFLEGSTLPGGEAVRVDLNQQGRRFSPEILIVPVGSTVSFPNLDPLFHNVYSLSNTKPFDLGYYPAGHTRQVRFDHAGVVQVYCHVHPNMYAAIVVAPSRWYARPDEDGTFTFSGVPAGSYRLAGWHRTTGFARKTVRVREGAVTEVVVTMPVRDEER